MKRGLSFLILFVLVLLFAAYWLSRSSERPAALEFETAAVDPATAAGSRMGKTTPTSATTRRETPVSEVTPSGPAPAPLADISIRGRFIYDDDAPAPGVEISIAHTIPPLLQAQNVDLVPDATRMLGTSDSTGAFLVRFAPVRLANFELRAKVANSAVEIWTWPSIEPGAVIDLGAVRLRAEGIVYGRVLDMSGVGMSGWTVSAANSRSSGTTAPPSSAQSATDGSYRLENLPAGSFDVSAMAPNSSPTKRVSVRVVAGQRIEVDLRYEGPSLSRRIVVQPRFDRTNAALRGDWIEMALLAPGAPDRRPAVINSSPMRFYFDDVAPGEYSIQLRDPRFRQVTVEHVQPGAVVEVDLVGGASIALSVVDDATGESIDRYSLETRNESHYARGRLCKLLDDNTPHPLETIVEGVLVIDQTLIVRAAENAPLEIPIRGLQRGERRAVAARLTPGVVVEGVVIGAVSRKPVPAASVRLLKKLPPVARGQQRPNESLAGPNSIATSDAEGRFKISGVALGELEAAVTIGSIPEKRTPLTIMEPGVVRVELEAPAAGRLVGRLIAPSGASLADFGVFVAHVENSADRKNLRTRGGSGARIEANGDFVTPWIEAGDTVVRLMQRRERTEIGAPNWSQNRLSPIELGRVTLAVDSDTHQDFDLREAFPSSADVYVSMTGVPATALDVELRDVALDNRSWVATTDEKGRAHLTLVPPSTYFVLVRGSDSQWVWTDPRRLRVDPGITTRHDAVVELVEVELTIRAGNPLAPLASSRVKLDPVGVGKSWGAAVTTDASGRVQVKLQLGRWIVRQQSSGRPQQQNEVAELEVSASGPRSFTVDLIETPR